MIIGYTIGSATTQEALMLAEKKVRVGTYVILEYDDMKVLGVITAINRGSPMLDEGVNDVEMVGRIKQLDSNIPHFLKANIKLLCKLDNENFNQPDYPPSGGTQVRLAEKEELQRIFSQGDVRIGTLVGTDVEVRLKVNTLSRHLAILAATGSGKSNTVAVLTQRLSELGGTSVIFDYHGEYYSSDVENKNLIEPRINPLMLAPKEFATLIDIKANAFKQFRILRRAFEALRMEFSEKLRKGGDLGNINSFLFESLENKVKEEIGKENLKKSDTAGDEVLNKIEEFRDKYFDIIDVMTPDVVDMLKPGKVNIVNLSSLDEEAMDAIISHYLRRILDSRKEWKNSSHTKGLSFPVILVIEEAHVFLNKTENTLTKYWASRIAREGRKFGVSLVIVSQRPKGLDENILSQMTNKIVLKIVEPNDKNYVLEASDDLSEDLVNQLPSLNVGEAIVIGKIVKIPAIVKVDKFPGKLGGTDPDLIKEWQEALKASEGNEKIAKDVADMGVLDDDISHI